MSEAFFFEGAGRRAAVDALFDAVAARALVVLAGESGSGRSVLLQRFAAEADPEVLAIAAVTGDILMSPLQCVQAVAAALGAADSYGGGLAQAFAEVRAGGRHPVVLVDDAHELGEETLSTLVDACAADEVPLVLAGEPALADALAAGVQPQVVRLAPLREQDTEDFLAGLLAVDHEDALPSHRVVARLHRQSAGLPGRLVQLVEAGGLRRGPLLPAGLPVWHVGFAVLALVLLVVLLTRMDFAAAPGETVVELEIPVPPPQVPAGPAEPPSRLTAVAAPAPLDDVAPVVPLPPPAGAAVAQPASATPPPAAAPVLPAAAATPARPAEPPRPVAPAAPARPAAPVVARYTPDEQWLLAQKASRHTLQVFASFNEDSVKALQARFPGQVRTFRTVREDLPWHVAVVGDFRNRDEARAAAGKLPAGLAELKPWPRSFQGIQDELRRRK